jgi:hypothetical protein
METVKHADIFLAGVGESDVYLDLDFIRRMEIDIPSIKKGIISNFSKKPIAIHGIKTEWIDSSNDEKLNNILRSYSSYELISKRDDIAICCIESILFDIDNINNLSMSLTKTDIEQVIEILGQKSLVLKNIQVKFYAYGNVVILGQFEVRKNVTVDQYNLISKFAHGWFGPALKEISNEIILAYKHYMEKSFGEQSDKNLLLLIPKINIDINQTKSTKNIEQTFHPKALRYSIRYHFIYNSELKRMKIEGLNLFKTTLCGEWELELENSIFLNEATVYMGWSQSMFIFDDYTGENMQKYVLPLQTILANWSSLNSISEKIDYAISYATGDMLSINKGINTTRNYSYILDSFNEFSMKLERIIEYYDSYTVTNNPTNYKLIDLQQTVFLQDRKVAGLKNKMILLTNIIKNISVKQKNLETKNLNTLLLFLTLMSLINNANVIYQIITGNDVNQVIGVIGIIITLLLLIKIYTLIRKRIN